MSTEVVFFSTPPTPHFSWPLRVFNTLIGIKQQMISFGEHKVTWHPTGSCINFASISSLPQDTPYNMHVHLQRQWDASAAHSKLRDVPRIKNYQAWDFSLALQITERLASRGRCCKATHPPSQKSRSEKIHWRGFLLRSQRCQPGSSSLHVCALHFFSAAACLPPQRGTSWMTTVVVVAVVATLRWWRWWW